MGRPVKVRDKNTYQRWRRELGLKGGYFHDPDWDWEKQNCHDLDNVEWRFDEAGNRRLAGFIEASEMPLDCTNVPKYLASTRKRWLTDETGQPGGLRYLMDRFDVKAWIVLYETIFTQAWVLYLGDPDGDWELMTLNEYHKWLKEI